MRYLIRMAAALATCTALGCGGGEGGEAGAGAAADSPAAAAPAPPPCDADNGGLQLADGFCALVVADGLGGRQWGPRHLAVAPNGDLYVALQAKAGRGAGQETPTDTGGAVALRDTTGDGKMDVRVHFGPEGGTGIELRDGQLYFATNRAVLRYRVDPAGLAPAGRPDTVVHGLPGEKGHTAKSIALGSEGGLFVNIGSVTNACQPVDRDRQPAVRGEDPCAQLDTTAGVWRFDAGGSRQTLRQGERWATGIRNAVALAWNPADDTPWAAQHGRDQLNQWPPFTAEDNAEGPAEELQRLTRGADFGWPYCFFDTRLKKRVLAPEYGGKGQEVGRCADKALPVATFPGHWAPNALLFYTGRQFPAQYRGGAFIAFHGSWNRAPLPQAGYRVVFQPLRGSASGGAFQDFATGFAGANPTPDAPHRPMGLAQGPDGSLYVSDDAGGRIWRVVYRGPGASTASR